MSWRCVNLRDCHFFTFQIFKGWGCYDNFVPNFPVYWLFVRTVHYVWALGDCINYSPCLLLCTVERDLAICTSNTLVSKEWYLVVTFQPIKIKVQLVGKRLISRSCNKPCSHKDEVRSVNLNISFISNLYRWVFSNDSCEFWSWLIHIKMHVCWNVNEVTFDGW